MRFSTDYISEVKGLEYVVGLGGGRAIDSAKYVAWKTGGKFVSIPTVIGADAYMTPVAAVRTEGIVSYLGPKFADAIVIDGELIRTAPPQIKPRWRRRHLLYKDFLDGLAVFKRQRW